FFQAEDGIRDYKVTGVQTCALPIYIVARSLVQRIEVNDDDVCALADFERADVRVHVERARAHDGRHCESLFSRENLRVERRDLRSEERRVGKSVELGGRSIIKNKKE